MKIRELIETLESIEKSQGNIECEIAISRDDLKDANPQFNVCHFPRFFIAEEQQHDQSFSVRLSVWPY